MPATWRRFCRAYRDAQRSCRKQAGCIMPERGYFGTRSASPVSRRTGWGWRLGRLRLAGRRIGRGRLRRARSRRAGAPRGTSSSSAPRARATGCSWSSRPPPGGPVHQHAHALHLRVQVVQVVQQERLGEQRHLGRTELELAVMAEDQVLDQRAQPRRKVREAAASFSSTIRSADDDVSQELAFAGVSEAAVVAAARRSCRYRAAPRRSAAGRDRRSGSATAVNRHSRQTESTCSISPPR